MGILGLIFDALNVAAVVIAAIPVVAIVVIGVVIWHRSQKGPA